MGIDQRSDDRMDKRDKIISHHLLFGQSKAKVRFVRSLVPQAKVVKCVMSGLGVCSWIMGN